MLAPVTHPWRGGVGWYTRAVTTPLIGSLLAYTITLPLGLCLTEPAARSVFLPQTMPDGFVKDTATLLLLRPREFLANASDLVTLKGAVIEQVQRYREIGVPTTVISGDSDKTVSTDNALLRGCRAPCEVDRAGRCLSHGAADRAGIGDRRSVQ
jgi:pimeloyl-ACP methyl ester carboxylesterase